MIDLLIQESLIKAFESLFGIILEKNEVSLSNTKKEFEGDFTFVVFPFVKRIGKSPMDIANQVGEYIIENMEEVESYNVIQGFLNFKVSSAYWLGFVDENKDRVVFGYNSIREEKPVVIEYSSPNTNKPLHLGHIRNILLGWSISEILKADGYAVRKVNLVNDRGIHICKSMLAWMKWGNGETPESSGIKGDHLVGKYYVLFDEKNKDEIIALKKSGMSEEEAERSTKLLAEAQELLKKWEAGDEETIELWKKMNSWVYDGFDVTYERMGIDFDKIYYESDTYLLGKEIVSEGLEKDILNQKDDGSIWADLSKEGLDEKLLQRGDGTSVYMTQDLGTAVSRHDDFDSDKLIYVVGNEQNYHFEVLKVVLQKLGYEWSDKLFHLSYGMVELPDGRMKSREGTVVDADDLIDEMIETARLQSIEHGKVDGFTEEELTKLYHTVAMGALKYFILKVDPVRNMTFNPEESIDFNGNTGPFVQYTHARIRSIIRKAEEEKSIQIANFSIDKSIEISDKEKEIIRILYQYPKTIEQAANTYSPALIANYVYDLARAFNTFYQDSPILREEDEEIMKLRLSLSSFVANVIKTSMSLLGIRVPERM